jgi:hypothetical protein
MYTKPTLVETCIASFLSSSTTPLGGSTRNVYERLQNISEHKGFGGLPFPVAPFQCKYQLTANGVGSTNMITTSTERVFGNREIFSYHKDVCWADGQQHSCCLPQTRLRICQTTLYIVRIPAQEVNL